MENEHHSPTMADRAEQICHELKVCREEAIFYLEGFDWKLDAAMEACRSRTLHLPSLTVESPPREKSTSTPPLTTDSLRSPNPPDERSAQSKDELIIEFYNVAVGADVQDAASYLDRNNWDLQRAISQFLDERRHTPSQRKVGRSKLICEEQIPKARPLMVSSQLKIQESTSREEKLSPVKESAKAPPSCLSSSQLSKSEEDSIKSFREFATGASRKAAIACLRHRKWNAEDALAFFFKDNCTEASPGIASSQVDESLQAKAVDEDSSTESLEEAGGEYIREARRLMASSQVKMQNIQESSSPTQTREETLSPVKEFREVAPPMVIDSRTSSNQLPRSAEQPSQWNDEQIDLFVEVTGGLLTRDGAKAYLMLCSGDLAQAVGCLMEEEQTSQVQASHGSRTQCYLEERETGSSLSSSNADPTETGNVSVPIPGNGSSLVDENLKDKAVDEDSSTELADATTIELEIRLANGGSGTQVWIPLRSDETVRDIRNKVEAFTPDNNRDYYFVSDTGVEYMDLNTTVHRITSGSRGSTTLLQLYST